MNTPATTGPTPGTVRVHRRRVRRGVRRPRGGPVDGPGRVRARQRRGGELQLHPRTRAALRRRFATKDQARREVAAFIDCYNHRCRHSSAEMMALWPTSTSSPNGPPGPANRPPKTWQHERRARRYRDDQLPGVRHRVRPRGPSAVLLDPLPPTSVAPPARRPHSAHPRQATTIYECHSCGTRALGEQYCQDCRTFTRRVGPGGPCPHCDELVALQDIINDNQLASAPRRP